MNIFMIEEIYQDCDWHYEIKDKYGYFLTRDSAEDFIKEYGLEVYNDNSEEGYRVVEIQQNK